jgi:thiamine pyrophosphate-dependent acetolactate synthase large subunit-like protein
VAVASGYGVPSSRVESADELSSALERGIASSGPSLVEVRVAPGMALV